MPNISLMEKQYATFHDHKSSKTQTSSEVLARAWDRFDTASLKTGLQFCLNNTNIFETIFVPLEVIV